MNENEKRASLFRIAPIVLSISILFIPPVNAEVVWQRKSSSTGDMPVPNSGKEKTCCLILDIDKDGVDDFVTRVCYGDGTEGYDRYSILYLDLPIVAGYRYKDIRAFIGPFFDYCLGGTNQHNLEYFNGDTDEGTIGIDPSQELKSSEITEGIFPLKRQYYFDSGIILGVGYSCQSYSLDFSYSYGLVNIFPKVNDETVKRNDYSLYTRVLMLRLKIYI